MDNYVVKLLEKSRFKKPVIYRELPISSELVKYIWQPVKELHEAPGGWNP